MTIAKESLREQLSSGSFLALDLGGVRRYSHPTDKGALILMTQLVAASRRASHDQSIERFLADEPLPPPVGNRGREVGAGSAAALVAWDCVAMAGAIVFAGEIKPTAIVPAAFAIALLASGGFYRGRLNLSLLDDIPGIVGRLLAAAALGATYRQIVSRGVTFGPRLWLVAVSITFVLLGRTFAYSCIRYLRRRGRIVHPTLVVGAGKIAHDLVDVLAARREFGLDPIAFYDPDPLPRIRRSLPVFRGDVDLADVIAVHRVSVVVVAFSSLNEQLLVDALRACDRLQCEIFMVPRLFELSAPVSRHVHHVGSVPLIRLNRAPYRSPAWRVKRVIDIVVAGAGLLVLSPLLALLALAVRLEGGPGVIFRQERVGVDQRRFTIYKFRTLRPAGTNEASTTWNIRHDHRLRPIGRLLRISSLDELPQLWNVVKGDMSLVGPRPERPHFVGQFSQEYPRYPARHRVPCGLTGWAQVQGLRGDTSIEERARFDNHYIESWSLWNDVKIILRTVTAVIVKRGG